MSLVQQKPGNPLAGWLSPGLIFALIVLTASFAAAKDKPPNNRSNLVELAERNGFKTAVFAGGCFWCMEKDFERCPGVIDVVSGYSGGKYRNPTYETYHSGGHREAILVTYDPRKVTFAGLVEFLVKHVDPNDKGGSFIDRGSGYSPAIYVDSDDEKSAAQQVFKAIDAMKVYRKAIMIPILSRVEFWPAEEYHQDYHSRNALAYNSYRATCGRDDFVREHWGDRANELILPISTPNSKEGRDGADEPPAKSKRPWENFQKPSSAVLRKKLTVFQFRVTQNAETETAFHNAYWNHHVPGIYVDIVSGEPLFASFDKFDSGTGWPSFVKPLVPDYLVYREDRSEGQVRTEVRSKNGDSHLGHVFSDGPEDRGGNRYCMNSGALRFIPKGNLEKEGYGEFAPLFDLPENKPDPKKGKR